MFDSKALPDGLVLVGDPISKDLGNGYTLWQSKISSEKGYLNQTAVTISHVDRGILSAFVHHYSHFPSKSFIRDGHTYLIAPKESYMKFGIYDLDNEQFHLIDSKQDTGEPNPHKPGENWIQAFNPIYTTKNKEGEEIAGTEAWCFTAAELSPDTMRGVFFGCYWAFPYDMIMVDLSDITDVKIVTWANDEQIIKSEWVDGVFKYDYFAWTSKDGMHLDTWDEQHPEYDDDNNYTRRNADPDFIDKFLMHGEL